MHTHLVLAAQLIALLLCFTHLADAGPRTCPHPKLCLTVSTVPNNESYVDVTISTTVTSGWVAVGVGARMASADILMMWKTASMSNWTVTRRYASRHDLPSLASTPNFVVMENQPANKSGDFSSVTLRRPLMAESTGEKALAVGSGATSWIWAFFESTSVSTNNLPQHRSEGTFKYDLLNSNAPAGPPAEPEEESVWGERLVITHGVLMAVSWSLLSFAAIFSARFLKGRLLKSWFNIHRGLFAIVLVFTLLGFALIVKEVEGDHFDSPHAIIGLVVVILMVLQVVLGIVIDKKFDPNRTKVPLHDKVHWAMGYALGVLAPLNVFLGHILNDTPITLVAINGAVVGVSVLALGAGQIMFGQTHEHKAAAHKRGSSDSHRAHLTRAGSYGDQAA